MTTLMITGTTGDGYVESSDASLATARAGAGFAVNTAAGTLAIGQSFAGGKYFLEESFVGFTYAPLPSDSIVVSATARLKVNATGGTGVSRALEIRSRSWTAGGLTSADWANAATLAGASLLGVVPAYQAAGAGRTLYAGSEGLRAAIAGTTSQEWVLVSDRMRAGTAPTGDEGGSLVSADAAGSTSDPALIYSYTKRSQLHGVLGAMVRVPSGWMYLESDGAASPTITMNHIAPDGSTISWGVGLPIGTAAGQFAPPVGAQALTLIAGPDGSVYVVGKAGNSSNSLAVQMWQYEGALEWTAWPVLSVALPTHSAWVNQVAGCYQVLSGTHSLFLVAGHQPGDGVSAPQPDLAWVILDQAALLSGTATVRASGSAVGSLTRSAIDAGDYSGFANEVGSGLDVAADVTPGGLFMYSFQRGQRPGDNAALDLGRGVYAAGSNGLAVAGSDTSPSWATKDAAGKVRVLSVGGGVAVTVSADGDSGYGITVVVNQYTTGTAGVELGRAELAGESIPSMPDGPTVASVQTWDAVHSPVDNAVWIYYVDVANSARLMRTAFSLTTYQATRSEVAVMTAPAAITAVRAPRNAPAGDVSPVSVAWNTGGVPDGTVWMDSFNLPPLAPTLTHRDGADATGPITLTWTFNDPNPTDSQSAYRLEVQDTADNSVVYDSGKVASSTQNATLAGGTLANGHAYQWRVMTWDHLDQASPWSEWETLETAAGGTVTITSPAVDNDPTLVTDDALIQWSTTGTVQAAYRVKLYRVGSPDVLISDTNWVASTDAFRTVAGMASDTQYRVEVQVRNSAMVTSNVGTRLLLPSYSLPEKPIITVTPEPGGGYTLITVQNPEPTGDRPNVTVNSILRRRAGSSDPWEILGTCGPSGQLRDYTAAANQAYEYVARGATA